MAAGGRTRAISRPAETTEVPRPAPHPRRLAGCRRTPLPKIQQRLGHESIQTTIDVYGGLLADTDDQVDCVVAKSFGFTAPLARTLATPANRDPSAAKALTLF